MILLAGATGLIGAQILDLLLAAQRPELRILAPVRRPLESSDLRLTTLIGDWADSASAPQLEQALGQQPVSALICALGTTIKVAGSKAAFSAVDHDLVLRLAVAARNRGARQAILVSSVGADPASSNFYLAIKGRTERALQDLGFARLDLLRPSLLLGQRSQHRPAEALGRVLAPLFNPLLLGGLRRYRAIDAQTVAQAAVHFLGARETGVFVHEFAALADAAALQSATLPVSPR